ncbi:hypothetical protein [Piscinibacter gummiphilus]|uniref:Uncharacterized protein n=1 Tax=Piscinibacter gummiphilus TaxID=946333 RepID=A0ABZ0CPP2_9BURK|nr:hypothetical protein [Piscinibacter gummiphilus]WOB06864.1 hypothetical protein RXV79_18300 [Piscinibacter gummiphilus]
MSYITADELELLTFFAIEPKRLDPETTWPYNDFVYEVKRGDMSLSFAIHPAYKDVRIILKHLCASLYELNAVGVEDLKYHNDSGKESLEVIISAKDKLWLRIDPSICIGHQTSESDA